MPLPTVRIGVSTNPDGSLVYSTGVFTWDGCKYSGYFDQYGN